MGKTYHMNNFFIPDPIAYDLETDDFALTNLLQKIQNGEDVASEEFNQFLKKGKELILALQRSLLKFGTP